MDFKQLAEKYNDYILEQRRFFHRCPEPSHYEENTTKAIGQRLQEMGIDVSYFKDGLHGCVGKLVGGKPGPTVLLRADIDALPVQEKTGLPFASEVDGMMHACGHDNHIAMQLGAAKILTEAKDELPGTVLFFFQSAEETAQGALQSITQGVLKDVSAAFGMHIWGQIDAPHFNIQMGPRMASADKFIITIKGYGSHGSAPQHGKDALLASASVIMNLQSIVSRMDDPLNPMVVTLGMWNGGQRFNIVADNVVLEGTLRTFDREYRQKAQDAIREISEYAAKCYGCTVEIDYQKLTGPVINESEELVKIAQNAAIDTYGEDYLTSFEMVMGSEDYAYIMEEVPAIYGFLGGRSASVPGSERSNHHEQYTVDEDALRHGAAISARFAYDFLVNAVQK